MSRPIGAIVSTLERESVHLHLQTQVRFSYLRRYVTNVKLLLGFIMISKTYLKSLG